jgi:hypothetical protein
MTRKKFRFSLRTFLRMLLLSLGLLTLTKFLSSIILNLILSGYREKWRQAQRESEIWMEALLEEMPEGQSTEK